MNNFHDRGARESRLCLPLLLCLLLPWSPLSWSAKPHSAIADGRWFTAATLSLAAADLHSSSHGGSIGTGELIDGEVDGQLRHTSEVDAVAGVGMSVGWQNQRWSLETEALWRVRTDWDLAAPTPSLATVTNVQTNISNTTVLLNGFRTFRRAQRWQWHLGAGIGVAFNRFDSDFKLRAVPGVSDAVEINHRSSSSEFAWNLSIGVQRTLGARWATRLRYRFLDLGDVNAGPYRSDDPTQTAGTNVRFSGKHRAHELQLTLLRLAR